MVLLIMLILIMLLLSLMIMKIIKYFKDNNISYMALAPTHKACRQIGKEAQTIHSFFSKFTEKSYSKLNKYQYIIIDEKSMIKEIFYRVLFHLKKNTTCKFII